jgi:O-antigen/teichoic acid export membrane protein
MIAEAERRSPPPPLGGRVRWSLLNSACGLATSLAGYAVIGRFVAPAEYGRLAVILSMWGLCTSAIDWCGNLMMRYGPVELSRRDSLGATLSARLVLAAPSLALLLPGAPLYLRFARGWPAPLLALTVTWLLVSAAVGVGQWSAVAAQRFRPLTAANLVMRATVPAAILVLAAQGRAPSAESLACATVAGAALGAALLIAALRGLLALERPDRALLRSMWRYSLPSLIAAPSLAAMSYLDPLVLARSASHADVGRYQLAYVTVTVFGMIGASLNGVLSPELVGASARGERGAVDAYRLTHQPRLALALGLLPLAGACVAGPLARGILPQAYAPAGDVAALLCAAGGLMMGVWSFHPLVTVTDSVWALQLATIASAATNVALDLALAPRLGAGGVALANVAAWTVQLVVLAVLLRRRIGARLAAVAPLIGSAAFVSGLLAAGAPFALRAAVGAALLAAGGVAAWRAYPLWRSKTRPAP